jgi:hypothetical protein
MHRYALRDGQWDKIKVSCPCARVMSVGRQPTIACGNHGALSAWQAQCANNVPSLKQCLGSIASGLHF